MNKNLQKALDTAFGTDKEVSKEMLRTQIKAHFSHYSDFRVGKAILQLKWQESAVFEPQAEIIRRL